MSILFRSLILIVIGVAAYFAFDAYRTVKCTCDPCTCNPCYCYLSTPSSDKDCCK